MLQYVNSFSCSLNESKDTLVIHFLQNEPIISDENEGDNLKIVTHNVASIVLDSDCAHGLMSSLAQLYSSSEEESDN